MVWFWIALCAVALIAHLYAEYRGIKALWLPTKPIASASFIGAAVTLGATETVPGQALLLALVWSFIGDVLLMFRTSKVAFGLGIAAFAMAHIGYAFVFNLRGLDWTWVLIGGLVAGGAGAVFFNWLRPHIERKARGLVLPVAGYIVIITIMVAFAIGSVAYAFAWLPLAAALCFWGSDLTVAMVRFAGGGPRWRLIGLPLYYLAQMLFVATLA